MGSVLLAGGAIMVINNPNAIPGVKFEVNTPKPVVITSRANESKSGLFNARMTVYASVIFSLHVRVVVFDFCHGFLYFYYLELKLKK